jgi:hypothetical protein
MMFGQMFSPFSCALYFGASLVLTKETNIKFICRFSAVRTAACLALEIGEIEWWSIDVESFKIVDSWKLAFREFSFYNR